MRCGNCGPFGCYVQCPMYQECKERMSEQDSWPGGVPSTAINPAVCGYDRELENLSSGSAKYNAHWRPCFNPNGFTPFTN